MQAATTEDLSTPSMDIVALIDHYVPLEQAGRLHKGYCPFCRSSRAPSFIVEPQLGEWHCFACGLGGEIADFIGRYEHIGREEALRLIQGISEEQPTSPAEDTASGSPVEPLHAEPATAPSSAESLDVPSVPLAEALREELKALAGRLIALPHLRALAILDDGDRPIIARPVDDIRAAALKSSALQSRGPIATLVGAIQNDLSLIDPSSPLHIALSETDNGCVLISRLTPDPTSGLTLWSYLLLDAEGNPSLYEIKINTWLEQMRQRHAR